MSSISPVTASPYRRAVIMRGPTPMRATCCRSMANRRRYVRAQGLLAVPRLVFSAELVGRIVADAVEWLPRPAFGCALELDHDATEPISAVHSRGGVHVVRPAVTGVER